MQKLIKTSNELIEHMKNKEIKFNIISEIEAKKILENNNYYFKLAAYRNNYFKKPNGEYIDLKFAYLRELSIIDMELRHLVLEMALDIEHSLKVILLNDIANNFKNNSYDIVSNFLTISSKKSLTSISSRNFSHFFYSFFLFHIFTSFYFLLYYILFFLKYIEKNLKQIVDKINFI